MAAGGMNVLMAGRRGQGVKTLPVHACTRRHRALAVRPDLLSLGGKSWRWRVDTIPIIRRTCKKVTETHVMLQALINGRIATKDGMLEHHAVLIDDGWITDIVSEGDDPGLERPGAMI